MHYKKNKYICGYALALLDLFLLVGCGNAQIEENEVSTEVSQNEQISADTDEEPSADITDTDAMTENAQKVLDEMLELSTQGWNHTETHENEQAKEAFFKLIELKDSFLEENESLNESYIACAEQANPFCIYVKHPNALDVAQTDETIAWLKENSTYSGNYLDLSTQTEQTIDSLLHAIDCLCIDAYAGITENVWSMEGQQAAADYAKELYQSTDDLRIRTVAELFSMDGVTTAYERGYADSEFLKAESDKLLPVIIGKIEAHGAGTIRLIEKWKKPLALFYYILEDFDTYMYVAYDGQDLDEIEPVEVVDNEQMTNLEYIHYGLRWNEEKEEYETYTLKKYWGYAEKKSTDVTYCNLEGKFSDHSFSPSEYSHINEKYAYYDDGRIANSHIVCEYDDPYLSTDITDTDYVWTSNMPDDLKEQENWVEIVLNAHFSKEEEDPIYYLTEQVTGDNEAAGSTYNETEDKYNLYGVLIFD